MPSTDGSVNILCVKWGDRYSAEFVNILFRSVKRNLTKKHRFFCVTEDSSGLDEAIQIIPFPENPGVQRGWPDVLVKLMVFADGFGDLYGPTLFLDLDVVIMGELDVFFDYYPEDFCIIHDWNSWQRRLFNTRPALGNSSVFRFFAGKSSTVYERFVEEMADAENTAVFSTEQSFMTYAMGDKRRWWPEHWVVSFKESCKPTFPTNYWITPSRPKDCRILVFHGRPDSDVAIVGFKGKRLHHFMLPSPWIKEF